MATRWLLSVLLVNLTNCSILGRPPAPPSPPDCYIPCDESYCFGDVYCSWDPRQESQIPTNYSLQWRTTQQIKKEVEETPTTKCNGWIDRNRFSDPATLVVWVQAKNQHGSAISTEVVYNTTDIIKPPPPKFSDLSDDEAFEIHWDSFCDRLMKFVGFCDVRYRTDTDQIWIERTGFYSSFTVENPQNCTAYELQVRCACETSLASNWSASRRIPGLEMAPVGKVDVWMDCGISTMASDCILTWRKLPISQTCGVILGYEIRITRSDNTTVPVNLSTSQPMNQLKCDEMQCNFISLIKDATSVSLSAYNVHGSTTPSYLPKPVTGMWKTWPALNLSMSLEDITVSWKVPPQFSNNLKEYVVQYKQAGAPLGHAFSWVKVNKSQTTAFFKGQFKEYTPYQVSLFTVSHGNEVRYVSSSIGYSLQRAPAKVPSFRVKSIAATDVTVCWEPLPLFKQEGLILQYQIGVVPNERAYTEIVPGKTEMVLQHLSPGQEYEAWIRAMAAVGPGEKTSLRFKTKHLEYFSILIQFLCNLFILQCVRVCILITGFIFLHFLPDYWMVLGVSGFICIFFVVICVFIRKNKMYPLSSRCYCEQIPDPKNSHIFREMKHQLHDPVTWLSSPSNEPLPKIIVLEVVLIQPSLQQNSDADEPNTTAITEWGSPMECHENQKKNAVAEDHNGTKAYSKMVDSDEETSWSSSEVEPCISGYEKHFMPTAADIVEDF